MVTGEKLTDLKKWETITTVIWETWKKSNRATMDSLLSLRQKETRLKKKQLYICLGIDEINWRSAIFCEGTLEMSVSKIQKYDQSSQILV